MASLKEKFVAKVGPMKDRVQKLNKEFGTVTVKDVNVGQVIGGARGIISMLWDTSLLDPIEGIRFRGFSIPELREKLPKAPGGTEPLPEGIFYLLLLGEIPTAEDCAAVTEEWRKRSVLPQYLLDTMNAVPKDTHPMTQFSLAILQLQKESVFAQRYREKMPKTQYWDATFEDVMNLVAKLPNIAAYIYRRSYKGGKHIAPDQKLDWGGNLGHMLGCSDDPAFKELMRLYLVIHSDHEGGNVSAFSAATVNSALSDLFYALSAGLNGLAGPLHGLANQECLRWVLELHEKFGRVPSNEELEKFAWDTLNSGQVVPGYGHAVLRITDPRFDAFLAFGKEYCGEDPVFQCVAKVFDVVPGVLRQVKKIADPWPNVDAGSGALLYHFGLTEFSYYTVLFSVSRALGITAQAIVARAMGLPITRPKSVPTTWIKDQISK
jgi:citrate synthase